VVSADLKENGKRNFLDNERPRAKERGATGTILGQKQHARMQKEGGGGLSFKDGKSKGKADGSGRNKISNDLGRRHQQWSANEFPLSGKIREPNSRLKEKNPLMWTRVGRKHLAGGNLISVD